MSVTGTLTSTPLERAIAMTPAQRRTFDELIRGEPIATLDESAVGRVRARLEDAASGSPGTALRLGKTRLNDVARCPGLFDAVRTGERGPFAFSARFAAGRLAHKAVELEVAGREERDPYGLVEAASGRLVEDEAFAAYWNGLDPLRRDEALMDAAKTLELFRSTFPPLHAMRRELAPSTEWHVRVELSGGALVLSGTLDLVLGVPNDGAAPSRLAIDLKTGRAWPEHAEDMRFYALLLALRFGVPPYRVATVYLDSGEWQSEDVDERVLHRAVDRVIDALRTAAASDAGRPFDLRPGPYCTWCPRSSTCSVSQAAAR
jgi:PD-(D/E)XK nuclease superfamily